LGASGKILSRKTVEVENILQLYKIVFLTPEQGFIIGHEAFTEIYQGKLKQLLKLKG